MLELKDRCENIGRAVVMELATYGPTKVVVTFTESPTVPIYIVSVNTHPAAIIARKELTSWGVSVR